MTTLNSVYIAAPYAARSLAQGYAADLRTMLVEVTSRWLDGTVEIGPGTLGAATDLPDAVVAQHAINDIEDIAASELLILITEQAAGVPGTTGGRHVETGYALASGIPVLVVGEPENVFHRLGADYVWVAKDWPDAIGRVATFLAGGVSLAVALSGGGPS